MLGINQKLLDTVFDTDTAVTTPQAFRHCGLLSSLHTVEWSDGVSAGVVEIEAAPSEAYTGTWSPVATVTFSGTAPKVDHVPLAGSYPAFRHRISQIVLDGTVTTKISGSL